MCVCLYANVSDKCRGAFDRTGVFAPLASFPSPLAALFRYVFLSLSLSFAEPARVPLASAAAL